MSGFFAFKVVYGSNPILFIGLTILVFTVFWIFFNAFDALKNIDMYNNIEQIPKVSMSETWTKSRTNDRELDYVKPYDWTYTTRYKGKQSSEWVHPE